MATGGVQGTVIDGLSGLAAEDMLDADRLACIVGRNRRTLLRMVKRGELPPPIPFGGRSVWIAGRVRDHISGVADRTARAASREAERIRRLSP